MPSLADAILDARDIEDEIEDIEDEELSRELQKLHELRQALSSANGSRPSSRGVQSHVVSNLVAPVVSEPVVLSAREHINEQYAHSQALESARTAPKSLADHINSADDVEREFEAMEQELQEQLVKYKEQCKEAEAVRSPIAEKVLSTTVRSLPDASMTARSATFPSNSSCKLATATDEQQSACPSEAKEMAGEIITPELLELREEAAKMEEAFPAAIEAEESQAPTRKHRLRRMRDNTRAEISEDPEIIDLTRLLGSLDTRLGSIQQKHSLFDVVERDSGYASNVTSSTASKVISDMRAQNAHLRERFQASSKRGLLGLDASVFGAADSRPKLHQCQA